MLETMAIHGESWALNVLSVYLNLPESING